MMVSFRPTFMGRFLKEFPSKEKWNAVRKESDRICLLSDAQVSRAFSSHSAQGHAGPQNLPRLRLDIRFIKALFLSGGRLRKSPSFLSSRFANPVS
jgi:hypothetical protein